jgi:outer membrane lipoprotein-sorting protein
MKKNLINILLFAFLLPGALAAETGREIMQNVIDNQKASSSAMDIQMVLEDKHGDTSKRRIQTLVADESGQTKTITLFLEPASVKNTRFLTIQNESRDDDQWIYLPALRKVKRIAATEKNGSFMGSDFSYSDMSFSQGLVGDSTHTILKEETLEGIECYVVESVPIVAGDSSYGKQISWVDKNTWLTARVEFYATDKTTLEKVLTSKDFKQIQSHWIAGEVTMSTHATEHSTTLEIKQVKYDIQINPAYFTTGFLETGRTR